MSAEALSAPSEYPPPPWHLEGDALVAMRAIDVDAARAFVPERLRIARAMPGRTVGMLYCARYAPSSTLPYHELIVSPALVYSRGRLGFWISHIYVDHPGALAGGHEIWGLPKELAHFEWSAEEARLTVQQESMPLCALSWNGRARLMSAPLVMPAFSHKGPPFAFFKGIGKARLAVTRSVVTVPPQSPFNTLRFDRCEHVVAASHMKVRINAPRS